MMGYAINGDKPELWMPGEKFPLDLFFECDITSFKIGELKKGSVETLCQWLVEGHDLDYLYQLCTRDADIKIAITKDKKKLFIKITEDGKANKKTD